jgi:hypothetical protein
MKALTTASEFKTDWSSIFREIKTPTLKNIFFRYSFLVLQTYYYSVVYLFLWRALVASWAHTPTGSHTICVSNSKRGGWSKKGASATFIGVGS